MCIICCKSNIKMSIEHIVPHSMGGKLTTREVCQQCNSKLGSFIDALLIDTHFIRIVRHKLKLKDRSKKVVNPFNTVNFTLEGDHFKGGLLIDKEGDFLGYHIPPTVVKDRLGRSVEIASQRFASDLQRKSKSVLQSAPLFIHSVSASYESTEDLVRYSVMEVIKIGYEYTAIKLEGYMEDKLGTEIRETLYDAIRKNPGVIILPTEIRNFEVDASIPIYDNYISYSIINGELWLDIAILNVIKCKVLVSESISSYSKLTIPIDEKIQL